MRSVSLSALLCAACLLLFSACGQGRNATASGAGLDAPGYRASIMPGSVVAKEGSFSLRVLDASYDYGGSAKYSLNWKASEAGYQMTVTADAREIRSSLFELSYDASRWHPVSSRPGNWPGVEPSDLLCLTISGIPGIVHHGSVLTYPDARSGVSGRIEVLTLQFLPGPAPKLSRSAGDPLASESELQNLLKQRWP